MEDGGRRTVRKSKGVMASIVVKRSVDSLG